MRVTPDEGTVLHETEAERERQEDSPTQPVAEDLVLEDLLVEDVSIDGMCGVY
jgi:mycofactocin precursor